MRLKNKKTGEIRNIKLLDTDDYLVKGGVTTWKGEPLSLAVLNAEWEDAPEEPKEYWFIGEDGNPHTVPSEHYIFIERLKEFGNYFETEEEAKKAVEKLKAFANLRKRGLKFNGWDEADRGMVGEFAIYCDVLELDGIERELEIVFGREEL